MMKTKLTLSIVLLLLVSSATFAQTSQAVPAIANRSWPSFWQQFTAAVNKKDRVALLRMMPSDFFDGGGGTTASEWLQYLDENDRNGSWRDLKRSLAKGTVFNRKWSNKGTPT